MRSLTRRALSLVISGLAFSIIAPAFAQSLGGLGSKLLIESTGPGNPNDGDAISPRIIAMTPAPGQWVVDNLGVGEAQFVFDEPVTVPDGAVRAWTLNGDVFDSLGTSFDPQTNTLSVSFLTPVHNDVLTLVVDYTVTDAAGNALDGEIASPGGAQFPSGDSLPGGQAVFQINILQGDVNRNGVVDTEDADLIFQSFGQGEGDAGFSPLADLNSDGFINVLDVAIWINGEGNTLPFSDGVPPAVTQVSPEPGSTLPGDLATVELTFSEPVDLARFFNERTAFLIDGAGALLAPTSATLAPDGLSATYQFTPAADQCATYTINVTDALADASGALLSPPDSLASVTGLTQPAIPALDPHTTMTNSGVVTITGSAPGAANVRAVSPSGMIVVPVTNGVFTADVTLEANSVNQIFFSALSDCQIASPPVATAVTMDAQPPDLLVQFPDNLAEVTTDTTDVAGTVGDMLSGFMGLTVTINGAPAQVDVGVGTNGTFFASGVPLNDPGSPTSIDVVAADELGNSITRSITVTQIAIPDGAPQMFVVSGSGQTGQVGTQLSQPIVVQMLKGDGTPFAGKVVTFDVTRSDGRLAPGSSSEPGSMTLQVITDQDGVATASWTLGSDAGMGNNRVEATSADIAGTVALCATATAAPADQINIGSGNNQIAQTGAALTDPLNVFVHDGQNGAVGVPVTFTVTQGGGLVGGQSEVVVPTDLTGHAHVAFMLGPDGGSNLVTATFPGNPGMPATFTAAGVAPAEGQPTTFTGLVIDDANRPIEGVSLSFLVAGQSVDSTSTDTSGRFSFTGVPDGPARIFINGQTATALAGVPVPAGSFPALTFETTIIPGAANSLPRGPVLLPQLDVGSAASYDGTQDVVLHVLNVEGMSLTIKAGTTVTLPDGTVASPSSPVTLSVSQSHFDKIPMAAPDGSSPTYAATLQPGGTTFDPPVQITFPNLSGLPAGATTSFLSLNHSTNQFQVVANGRVTEDGAFMVSDPGDGLDEAGWHCSFGPPPISPTGDCENCMIDIDGPGFIRPGSMITITANGDVDEWTVSQPTPPIVLVNEMSSTIELTPIPDRVGEVRVTALKVASTGQTCSDAMDVFSGALEIVDPNNPSNRSGSSVSSNAHALATGGNSVEGFIADGVTPLLIRFHAPGPGTVQFTVQASDTGSTDARQVGVLSSPLDPSNSSATLNPLEAPTQATGGDIAFALLTAPLDFVRFPSDESIGGPSSPRLLEVLASFTPDDPDMQEMMFSRTIKLMRPPVLLVHGLWSNAATWRWSIQNDPRFLVYAVNYSSTNGSPIPSNVVYVQVGVQTLLNNLRSQQLFAGTQIDVFGHSMGGMLSRLWVADEHYKRDVNFMRGDVHKLITVDTPHSGSEGADLLISVNKEILFAGYFLDLMADDTSESQNNCVDCGAVHDLRTDVAPGLLPAVAVPAHAIIGVGGSDITDLTELIADTASVGGVFVPWIEVLARIVSISANAVDLLFLNDEHDVVVRKGSQLGGLTTVHSSAFGFLDGLHTTVTQSDVVGARAVDLLNASISNLLFAPGFPVPPSPAPTAIQQSETMPAPSPIVMATTGGIQIVSPAPGAMVTAGQDIVVQVLATGDFIPTHILAGTTLGGAGSVAQAPFEITFRVPPALFGQTEIRAIAQNADDEMAVATSIPLFIQSPAELQSVTINADEVVLFSFMPTLSILPVGHFADGVDRVIAPATLSYEVDDPTIASVDANGLVTGLKVGETSLTMTFQAFTTTIPVRVVSTPHDFDQDGDVDFDDFVQFAACFSGPNNAPGFVMPVAECLEFFDADADDDIDLDDFNSFLTFYSGPMPDCNENGQLDMLDVLTGASVDANHDGVPDECGQQNTPFVLTVRGNITTQNPDGSFLITNIPTPDNFGAGGPGTPLDQLGDDFERVTGVRTFNGATQWAFSEPFQITPGGKFTISDLIITNTPPGLPASMELAAVSQVVMVGETTQLTAIATLPDGSQQDATPQTAWTTYRTSNPAIALVESDGLVTGVAPGIAFITATNNGATAVLRITVTAEAVQTTVVGFAQLSDGSPVVGADVTTLPFGGAATTDAAGFFSLSLTVPFDADTLTISITTTTNGQSLVGSVMGIAISPDSFTDAGLITLNLLSTGPLFPGQSLPAGDSPVSVLARDFDGDGERDLVVVNASSNDVSILLGAGDGSFVPHQTVPVGNLPRSVTAGDFDGDGDLDLAVVNNISDSVTILRGDGAGTFVSSAAFSVGDGPFFVIAEDFDNDGDLDLAVANGNSDNVSILQGVGNGTFAPQQIFPAGDFPFSVTAGDFDDDGDLDLAVANANSDNVSVLLGAGDGSFAAPVNFPAGDGPISITTNDFDGDSELDLAVTNQHDDNVSILQGAGDGTFAPQQTFPADDRPRSVFATDFDGDGDIDLAIANFSSDNISILLGAGDGTFAAQVSYAVGNGPISVVSNDFDRDGFLDLAVANSGNDNVSILRGAGDGTFPAAMNFAAGDGPASIIANDFDGDGDLDLAVADRISHSVSILWGASDGTFAAPMNFPAGSFPSSVSASDFDGDGDLDFAVANNGGNNVSILLGDGVGAFSAPVNFAAGALPRSVIANDFDGDGVPDLAVANSGSDNVSILLGASDGTFAAPGNFAAGNAPYSVIANDFDGDGDLDLALANRNSNGNVSILLGAGDGTFSAPVNFAAGSFSSSVIANDLDGDGILDLAVGNAGNIGIIGNVSILIGAGDGTFAAPGNFTAGDSPQSVIANDFDGDGVLDLAVADTFGKVSILLGAGDGTFAAPVNFAAGGSPSSVIANDFDGDGDLDLAVANFTSDNVTILLNNTIPASPSSAAPPAFGPLGGTGLVPPQGAQAAQSAPRKPAASLKPESTDAVALSSSTTGEPTPAITVGASGAPSVSIIGGDNASPVAAPDTADEAMSTITPAPTIEDLGPPDAMVEDVSLTPSRRNAAGQRIGTNVMASGVQRAMRLTDSVTKDLGTLGGASTKAEAINSKGEVVGASETAQAQTHPFLFRDQTGMMDLGVLDGRAGGAMDINDRTMVVGSMMTQAGQERAFVWTPRSGMRDLNELLPAASAWVLQSAMRIDERGRILGAGLFKGEKRIFRLTIDPAQLKPALLGDLNGDGVVTAADLGALIGMFGTNEPRADLDANGVVDSTDVQLLLKNFGKMKVE